MADLNGRVAIVTGSAGAGIGQATARRLAQEGARIVVSDAHVRRTHEVADTLVQEGHTAVGIPCDVTDGHQVQELARRAREEFGRIDILVNNAGINRLSPLHQADDALWDLVLNVSLRGTFYCCRAVLPAMMERRYGRIINISSVVAWVGSETGEVPYAAAKAGIIGLTRCLAREVAKQGITVNYVMPGFIPNPFLSRIYSAEALEGFESQIPLGKGGEPVDIASAVKFLASEESRYVTGCGIAVTGGWFMY